MIVKGAVDVLLDRTDWIEMKGETYEITEETRRVIEEQNQKYSREGLRVLAFAYKEVSDETELTLEDEDHLIFLGLIAMMDPPREESKAAVEECKCAGIRPIMITGDHKVTAAAIAKRIGILENESEACEGAEIDKMSDEELKDFVEGISVYARVSPEHKIRIVRAWQEKGNIVSMTGDGVNDAPALKQADILLTMFMPRTILNQISRQNIQERYGEQMHVFEQPIDYSIKVAEHPAIGVSLLEYAPQNTAAISYRTVAEEVMQHG